MDERVRAAMADREQRKHARMKFWKEGREKRKAERASTSQFEHYLKRANPNDGLTFEEWRSGSRAPGVGGDE